MTDWAATASASFAGCGLLATAWQLRQQRAQAVEQRRLEIEGVSASWRPRSAPRPIDVDKAGFALWKYEFVVHNPGRLPISTVELQVTFPVVVQRLRGQHSDEPTKVVKMVHPVLIGGEQRRWDRTLRMKFTDAENNLHATLASVSFLDAQGEPHRNDWPRPLRQDGVDWG